MILRPAPVACVVLFLTIPLVRLFPNSVNPPPGKTGAPGDGSCTECHNSQPNTKGGEVRLEFPSLLQYTPGAVHRITVRITATQAGAVTGFQLTARVGSNPLEQAGSFTISDASGATIQTDAAGRQNVTHASPLPPGSTAFHFDWNAPSPAVGDVRFYVSAVGNVPNSTPGASDEVYTASYTLTAIQRPFPSGFIWQRLDAPTGNTAPAAISNDGRITGTTGSRGFIRNRDGSFVLFDGPSAGVTMPRAINSSGVVAGSYRDGTGNVRGFLRSAAGALTPIDVGGPGSTEILGINEAGQMVGSFTGLGSHGILLRSPTEITGPSLIRDARPTRIFAINSQNAFFAINGRAVYAADSYHGGFENPCAPVEIVAASMNDFGETVITCDTASLDTGAGPTLPFYTLYRSASGVVFPLLQDDPLSPLSRVRFTGINNSGEIVGTSGTRGVMVTPCAANASPASGSFTFAAEGGTGVVPMTAAANCHWFSTASAPWITAGIGAGSGEFRYTVAPNPSTQARTATLYVGGTALIIIQTARTCDLTAVAPVTAFGAQGGAGVVNVTSSNGCVWTLQSPVPWLTIDNPIAMNGTGQASFRVAANPTTAFRNTTLSIGSQRIPISQGAAACQFTLPETSRQAPSSGGPMLVHVSASALGCAWTAVSNIPWIVVQDVVQNQGSAVNTVTLAVAPNPTSTPRTGTVTIAGLLFTVYQPASGSSPRARFVPLRPCRVMDTRVGSRMIGPFGAPNLVAQNTREIPVTLSRCGIPTAARAYSMNVTVVPISTLGFLTLWPTGEPRPASSTVNSFDGRVVANAAIVPAGALGTVSVFASNDTDLVLDVNGYFVEDDRALTFYPIAPCRVADTRAEGGMTGAFGGPILAAQTTREIPVVASRCGIAQNAQAYSLNITAAPVGPLGFLTVWQSGQERPLASTLNAGNGQVVANAAIVPAGANGGISLFASNDTHVVVDINGFFGPPLEDTFLPNLNVNLSYYPRTPCRVVDTRAEGGLTGLFGQPALAGQALRNFPVLASSCNVDSSARVYVMNATVVPLGPLSYLTLFAAGQPLPPTSTLNSANGQVVANMALVQGDLGTRAISAFASNPTHLVLDISGYFAH